MTVALEQEIAWRAGGSPRANRHRCRRLTAAIDSSGIPESPACDAASARRRTTQRIDTASLLDHAFAPAGTAGHGAETGHLSKGHDSKKDTISRKTRFQSGTRSRYRRAASRYRGDTTRAPVIPTAPRGVLARVKRAKRTGSTYTDIYAVVRASAGRARNRAKSHG